VGAGDRVAEALRQGRLAGAHVPGEDNERGALLELGGHRDHLALVVALTPVAQQLGVQQERRLLAEPVLDGVQADQAGVATLGGRVGQLQDLLEQVGDHGGYHGRKLARWTPLPTAE
jgi:hypothetical protein